MALTQKSRSKIELLPSTLNLAKGWKVQEVKKSQNYDGKKNTLFVATIVPNVVGNSSKMRIFLLVDEEILDPKWNIESWKPEEKALESAISKRKAAKDAGIDPSTVKLSPAEQKAMRVNIQDMIFSRNILSKENATQKATLEALLGAGIKGKEKGFDTFFALLEKQQKENKGPVKMEQLSMILQKSLLTAGTVFKNWAYKCVQEKTDSGEPTDQMRISLITPLETADQLRQMVDGHKAGGGTVKFATK